MFESSCRQLSHRSYNLFQVQLEAAVRIQEIQSELAKNLAPALASIQESIAPTLVSFAKGVAASNLASQLPDLSVLARFGKMAATGELAPEFVQAAHHAVDGVEGYREKIAEFSVRAAFAKAFDAKTISEGTYIFVFILWLVGSLWVAGLNVEAKAISDAVGLSSAAGSHSVAKYVSTKTTKVVIKKRNTRRR